MEKNVIISGNEVKMRASALIPRLYRFKFGRDMISDMRQLQKAYKKATGLPADATEEEKRDAQLSVMDLTIFENVAYMMAKHAGGDIPDSSEEWLDSFDGVFSIYEVLPAILELWGLSNKTTSIPKKNKTFHPRAERGNLHAPLRPARSVGRGTFQHDDGNGL